MHLLLHPPILCARQRKDTRMNERLLIKKEHMQRISGNMFSVIFLDVFLVCFLKVLILVLYISFLSEGLDFIDQSPHEQ